MRREQVRLCRDRRSHVSKFQPKKICGTERFRFWTEVKQEPGESIQEFAQKIRGVASTCDFTSIENPLDEALRTRFICSVANEAVMESLFKIPEDELTFNRAVEVAIEVEEASKVAKATVHHTPDNEDIIQKINAHNTRKKPEKFLQLSPTHMKPQTTSCHSDFPFPKGACPRCGNKGHHAKECRHLKAECHFCGITGHIEKACLKKKFQRNRVVRTIHTVPSSNPLIQKLRIRKSDNFFELDSGARDNFCSLEVWTEWERPELKLSATKYVSATGDRIPIVGVCQVTASTSESEEVPLLFNVSKLPKLNILGRKAIVDLKNDMSALLRNHVLQIAEESESKALQRDCHKLCEEFKECFEPELGCLQDFELEVKFKPEAKPVFVKARTVPFSLQEDLNQTLEFRREFESPQISTTMEHP